MRQKLKRIIYISIGVIVSVALFIWYFFPVFVAKWTSYNSEDLKKYMEVIPIQISTLPSSPDEWSNLSIGDLKLKLPLSRYVKVGGKETYLFLCSDTGSVVISDIVPSREILETIKESNLKYPIVSYQEQLAILRSSPSDISFFNSRAKNKSSAMNQVLKAISIPGGGIGKILDVNTESFKALCIISDKQVKGYMATVQVYNKNETGTFSLLLKDYKDTVSLETDLLWVLGGIEMPDHILDSVQVKKDIATIVSKLRKT